MIKKLAKFPKFLREVKEELRKVNWSTREELIGATTIVIIGSVFFTTYIGLVDMGLSKLLQLLLK